MQKIMFSDKYGLTDAVLNGRKTQTRRIVPNGTPLGNFEETLKKSKYQIGEVVAIAQSYKSIGYDIASLGIHPGWNNKLYVCADFMPRQIRITDIRVERLQDISDEDCLKEGIVRCDNTDCVKHYCIRDCGDCASSPKEVFSALIDKVSGKGTWDSNPWVFVYDFELVK